MARRTTRQQAIVLWRTKLSEQDLILTLLARDGSQVRAVAKGGRKPGGRLASRVELFCESDFLLAKGRNLDIVSEAALVEAHEGLRGNLERVSAASAVCEIARLNCSEDIADPFMYAITSRALEACEQAPDQQRLDLVVAAYALKVMAHGGWSPQLDGCMSCGDAAISHFSVQMGGVLCASCARDIEGAIEMSRSELALVGALLASTFDRILEMDADVQLTTLMLSVAHTWCATHLDARLRAFEFMLSL